MIAIRADGGQTMGTGHIMRCLSIADELQKNSVQTLFILANEEPVPLLQERKQEYRVLHTAYDNMEGEISALQALLQREKPAWLLVDSYFAVPSYLSSVRKCVRTAYIDDLHAFCNYPVDLLINYQIYADEESYDDQTGTTGRFLTGPAYAPLRPQFQNTEFTVRERAENILICTGGGDKYNLAGQILQEMLSHADTRNRTYHVVCGIFNSHMPYLQRLAEEHPQIVLHQRVENMSELMQSCDIAISAGGTTLYELCAVGIPTLAVSFADNQEKIVKAFAERGVFPFGASFLQHKEGILPEMRACIRGLADSQKQRALYSRRERSLVDGLGAGRTANEFLK